MSSICTFDKDDKSLKDFTFAFSSANEIALGFIYIFFDKIFGIMVNKSTFSPALAAWLPLFIFGLLSIYLLSKSRR